MAISFTGAHFPQDIILMGVRWYVAYPLSTRHVEELMLERGVHVEHATINRWGASTAPSWRQPSIGVSAPCGAAGGWTQPIAEGKARGTICTVLETNPVKPWTFC